MTETTANTVVVTQKQPALVEEATAGQETGAKPANGGGPEAENGPFIDKYAIPLAIALLAIILITILGIRNFMSAGMPGGIPTLVVGPDIVLKSHQQSLITEINRQLQAWLALAGHYQLMGIAFGALGAGLTVIVGFVKEHTAGKMFLMAISATISVFVGSLQPSDKAERFMGAWRNLYGAVQEASANSKFDDTTLSNLATALKNSEKSLSISTPAH